MSNGRMWHRRHPESCRIFPGNGTGGRSADCRDQLNYDDSVATPPDEMKYGTEAGLVTNDVLSASTPATTYENP